MFNPISASFPANAPIVFGRLRWIRHTRALPGRRAIARAGRLTLRMMLPFSRYSRSSSTAMRAQLSSLSGVEAPKCGTGSTPRTPSIAGTGKSVA